MIPMSNSGITEYKSFLIVKENASFSCSVHHSEPPHAEAYFGVFDGVDEAKLAIDLIYDLLLHYCGVDLD